MAVGRALRGWRGRRRQHVAISTWADAYKERRRIAHGLAVRQAERTTAAADRRRTFEIENLQAAYDGLWLLGREMAKTHIVDSRAAKTEAGYGGTQLPPGVESDIALTSQATKAIRLILDDRVRALAQRAQTSINDVAMLGVKANIFGRGPVSAAEGNAAVAEATEHLDEAMTAIADRLRAAVQG